MNSHKTDLTNGPVFSHLIKLALPIIGASFMQMTYNLTDMIWLGMVGEDAVAAAAAAGFYVWIGFSILLITRVGAEVGVSQSLGREDSVTALKFIRHALVWAILITLIYSLLVFTFAPYLISFFSIESLIVNNEATTYLRIFSLAFIFTFTNPTFAGIYNGMGNSRSPFWYMSAGVILNLILDPFLIFGIGFFPRLEVAGAATASLISQLVVSAIFIFRFLIKQEMVKVNFASFKFDRAISLKLFKLGLPVAFESVLFAIFAMILAKMAAAFGAIAIAIQSIGAQIEAVSWMTSTGFATALSSFTGQNYGAGKWNRIIKGFKYTIYIGTFLGLTVSLAFLIYGESIFALFFDNEESQKLGAIYLKILAVSQLFMIYEIIARGAFNGTGRTIPPSLTGIVFTGFRIPLAAILIAFTSLGLYSVWWSITITSILKGVILPLWFISVIKNQSGELFLNRREKWIYLLPSRIRQQILIKKTE
ncbi:MATE family efflux transporter [Marinilabiliaceae bacterium ANBcel2]|nr:MATE family efflux transporter [Marinilabiliaceae bacterium ANBcel2]